jgi:hypothetical protein
MSYSIVGRDFEPTSGYQVEYGEIGVLGSVFITGETEFSEIYGVTLVPGINRAAAQESHNWFAYLIKDGEKISSAVLFTTDPIWALDSESCSILQAAADADDDDDDPVLNCIEDPCQSSEATNIKHIDFQPQVTDLIEDMQKRQPVFRSKPDIAKGPDQFCQVIRGEFRPSFPSIQKRPVNPALATGFRDCSERFPTLLEVESALLPNAHEFLRPDDLKFHRHPVDSGFPTNVKNKRSPVNHSLPVQLRKSRRSCRVTRFHKFSRNCRRRRSDSTTPATRLQRPPFQWHRSVSPLPS